MRRMRATNNQRHENSNNGYVVTNDDTNVGEFRHGPSAISTSYRSVSADGNDDHSVNQPARPDAFHDDDDNDDNDSDDDDRDDDLSDVRAARKTLINFMLMAVFFSANHGCVVSCLGLASARLGAVGAWQSGILYATYTGSALLGATYIVKRAGARNSLSVGMMLYCLYVACFWMATVLDANLSLQRWAAYAGAAVGGVGAGFLWTAQGAYFGQAAEEHARLLQQPVATSTASLAAIFSFCYLSEEVALRLLSTALLEWEIASWGTIFAIYTIIAMISTSFVPFLYNYPSSDENEAASNRYDNNLDDTGNTTTLINEGGSLDEARSPAFARSSTPRSKSDVFYKVTAAAQLLFHDPKMKYMIGLNAVFGFAAAFLNSYVNGQVVPVALNDPNSKYIGILSSWVSTVAAGMSLVFGRVAPRTGKGPILILGALCFGGVVLPFAVQPDATKYGWTLLVLIYTLHGTGRATFEGTLKAIFADYFPYEKEGAFANIIFQNGLSGSIGYILTFSLTCSTPSRYCIEYNDGSLHDVLTFVVLVLVSAVLAIVGYFRASALFSQERVRHEDVDRDEDSMIFLERNEESVSA